MQMKNLFLFIAVVVAFSVQAQDMKIHPVRVAKAVYYDVSPPLRDMPLIEPRQHEWSWNDDVIENPSIEREMVSEEVKARFDTVVDRVVQKNMGSRSARGPIRSFDGVKNVNGVYPPDTDGDVGPDHYFQMINLSFAIFDKQGNKLLGPSDNSTLWAGFPGPWTGTNDGDPVLLYDHLADRWIATQFAIYTSDGTFWELVAVSQTGDPLGNYYRYAFEFPDFNDYPKVSVWPDAYYATFNMFGENVNASVAAFEREKMINGDPDARMVYFDMPEAWSMMPADLDGPPPPAGTPGYFAFIDTWNTQSLDIYALQVDWDNPDNSTMTLTDVLPVDPFDPDVNNIPQPGTGTKLDPISDRLMNRLQYRNFGDHESMVVNHTVRVGNHAGIRWYEMRKDTGDWYLYQQSTYSPDETNRWMGSIAMNANGEIALGYSVSSSSLYPSVRYTGRSPDAPLGEMNYQEMELVAGTSSQSGINRWGDYSYMSVDPVDDTTFWYTQEYMSGGWKTRIGEFNFAPVLPPEIDAGNDTTYCQNALFVAHAAGMYVSSVLWTTSGDGRFVPDPPTSMLQGYIRGTEDIANGGFTLTVTAQGFLPGMTAVDSINVTLVRVPSCFAGYDTIICNNVSLMLAGTATDASSVLWTTDGDGTFDDPALLTATYTPGQGDVENGSVKLTLTAYPLPPCTDPDDDKVTITLVNCTGIEEHATAAVDLRIIPNPTGGAFTLMMEGVPDARLRVTLINQVGDVIMSDRIDNAKGHVTRDYRLSGLPGGIYFLKVNGDSFVKIEKMVLD